MAPTSPPRKALFAHFPFASVIAGVAAAVDFAVGKQRVTASTLFAAFGLGIGAGAVLGLLLVVMLRALRDVPRWVRVVVWAALGCLLAAWLIDRLGVLARLGGKDHVDAIMAGCASLGAGGLLTVVGLLIQPARGEVGWLYRTTRRALVCAPLLVALAAGFIVADRKIGVDAYASAHAALRVMAIAMLTAAAVALSRFWPRRLRLRGYWRHVGLTTLTLPLAWAISTIGPDRNVLAALLRRPFSGISLRTLRSLGDIDRDGYAPVFGGSDCAPFNPRIHPFARDVPGNGVDENCRLGDAPVVPRSTELPPIPDHPSPTSVVLITIDTLRDDHTSWGGKRNTTPEMKKWAESATRFTRAYTGGSWTSLALSSMLRGVFPRRLVWTPFYETDRFRLLRGDELDQLRPGEMVKLKFGLPSPEQYTPLQTLLRRRGMYTGAVVDDGVTGFLDLSTGAYPDFDEYHEVSGKPVDVAVTDAAIDFLDGQPEDRPFFLWAHYFGPHAGHQWHRGVPRWGNSPAGKYDHEIAWTDKQVGRLLARIDELAKDRPIAVIITADHGESISSTRRTHGLGVKEEDIHVPLIVRGPNFDAGSTVTSLVGTVDVVPTILAWTETPGPDYLDGVDLARIVAQPSAFRNRVLIAETWRFTADGEATHNKVAAFDGSMKLIVNLLDEALEARQQPSDKLRPLEDRRVGRLQEALDLYLEQTGPPDFRD